MRPIQTVMFVAASIWALVPGWTGEARLPILGADANMTARAVTLDPKHADRVRLGRLTYLGGVQLQSRDPAFGGFSSMAIAGDRFTLVSDGGNVVRFRMGANWQPAAIAFSSLPQGPGKGWAKRDRDSESLAVDPATGRIWVGFERFNAIWRYAPDFEKADGHVLPEAMANWPDNGGPESMIRLRDGRFVVIAETARPDPVAGKRQAGRQALMFAGDPVEVREPAFAFTYMPPKGFHPTDATELPDGRWLILNRRFAPPYSFSNVIVVVDPSPVRPGAVIRGAEVAQLKAPLVHDNFEGITTTVEKGRTIAWIVSDDNESALQRTLLLKFSLDR